MTFHHYLALSTDHNDPLIRALARDYGGGMWGETVADLRGELLPWAEYDQEAAIVAAEGEWRALNNNGGVK
jgi:hypothetical protein